MQATTDRLMLNVPHAIRDIPGWLLWKLEPRKGGGFDKMPYYVTTKGNRKGVQGTPEDRANLVTFKTAMEAFQGGGFDGVGIATLPGFGFVAGDFDAKEGKTLHPEAMELANTTYAEKSPSGKGLRALWLGSMDTAKNNTIGVEVFGSTGFVTITGNVINDMEPVPLPAHVRNRLEALTGVSGPKNVPDAGVTVIDEATKRDLRSALCALDADDRDAWVRMGHALKELGNVGRCLWLEWSQSSEKYDPLDAAKTWASLKPTKTGYQAVFARAQAAGWKNPAKGNQPSAGQVQGKKKRLTLDQFALNGQSAAMRKQMLEDKHILGKLALLGQCTVFFTERNGGKTLLTLWLLIQSIRQGVVRAEDVYYINSDDTHKGLVEKIEFAEQSRFKMLSDGYGGFKNDTLTEILDDLCESDNAHGKILILDTLKKFVEVMKVDKATEFMKKIRTFVLKGGSVIMLAHVNKHRGEDGKLVFKGTTDVVDDADCYYIMDKAKQGDKTIVTFENRKARGDVAEKVIYSFERLSDCGQTYADLLGTVQEVSEDAFKAARRGEMVAEMVTSNHKIICATLEAIEGGTTKRTELVDSVHAETGESKNRVLKILDQHTGTNFLEGHRWRLEKGDKNAKIYVPLMGF